MPSEKKVALISGANRGIGFETARQLGQKGITVVVGARTQQAAKEAADKLVAENIEAYPVTLDVTKDEDRKAAAKFVAEKFGTLDILVNNAGIGGEGGLLNAHTVSTTDEELQNVFNTNLFSVVSITREFLPLLKKSPAGRIVNLSSILGSLTLQAMPGSPIAPMKSFAYNASKTALNQFTVHLAEEQADHDQHGQQSRKDAPDAALVKGCQREAIVAKLGDQGSTDKITRDNEEDIDADIATLEVAELEVVKDHQQNGDGAQPINIGAVTTETSRRRRLHNRVLC
ncbi:NAD(P)-dependent dehydrogenase (short-subunit alcohol dehydrogenase family) [Edaphobacter lichenicola]|uniref:NAD(P)-dependent dehydrogenase (Short-subunit alcohol dehydrogenase family) n=1 Tax=Tunturiibacter gelidiferens TaxID=3069689 RepID=A0A9X0QJH5_9BACT|nr:SDR family NAD(P)-dependent oxidoreductase [Edaphobacter lichenicola]MBB5331647.1 NAD(P)-dependent dehydrogenase (short-subunit alcohol dehydrogenase family) [Edaphobacter lichenicola]